MVDVPGRRSSPGFVDAHMHLESTKLWVDEFVRTVLPLGTTAVAADPHEIANVFGIPGVVALIEAAAGLPFTFGVCASSCVPASPFESAGASSTPPRCGRSCSEHGAIGVAEVMNYPGVVAGDPEMLARIETAGNRRVDGHAPGLSRPAPRRLPRGRGGVRPRVHGARRGRGEAAQGHVGLRPPGLGQPEPAEALIPTRDPTTAPTGWRCAPTTGSPTRCSASVTSTTASALAVRGRGVRDRRAW